MPARGLTRFLLEAGFLVLAAAASAALHLSPLGIIAATACAFAVVAAFEWLSLRSANAPAPLAAPDMRVETGFEEAEWWPEANPEPVRSPQQPARWNVFELQSRARALAGGDPVRDEEREFLIARLVQFAGADGLLPAGFDAFVRESLPELLGGAEP